MEDFSHATVPHLNIGIMAKLLSNLDLRFNPHNPFSRLRLARAAISSDRSTAMEHFDQAIAHLSYPVDGYRYRGLAKISWKDFRGADEDLTKAIEADTQAADAELYFHRAIARFAIDNDPSTHSAFQDLDRAIALGDARFAFAYYVRGSLRAQAGDFDGAASDFLSLLQTHKSDAMAHLALANAYTAQKKFQPASRSYRDAIRWGLGGESQLHLAYGYILNALERPSDALHHFDKAVALTPFDRGEDARILYHRAKAKEALGDKVGAKNDARRAWSLDWTATDASVLDGWEPFPSMF